MKDILCTIVTPDYIDRALTVWRSAEESGTHIDFVVLTTGPVSVDLPGITVLSLQELATRDSRAHKVKEKYSGESDPVRWSLKPVLMSHLLRAPSIERVVYSDCDTCFFRTPYILLDSLGDGDVLLTPHWRPLEPDGSSRGFRINFLDGLFNAGCVAANRKGVDALDWWARACLYACEKDYERGLFHDQRYLDLLPIYFPNTTICRHQGFNLAWISTRPNSPNT